MSNEIKFTANFSVEKGFFKWSRNFGQMAVTMTGEGQRGGNVQTIGTSAEIINVGEVWTQGWCILQNMDATNYIEFGPYDGGSAGTLVVLGRLAPGGPPAIFPLSPDVTFGAIANTAACKLDVNVFVA
jgi:hypothetical protein